MKRILLLVLISICFHVSVAHKRSTHQYITIEAYNLLKLNLGRDVPAMVDRLHTSVPGDWGGPWQLGYITRGAYREDEEDPVYRLSSANPPTLYGDAALSVTLGSVTLLSILESLLGLDIDPFVTATHFWRADNSNTHPTVMHAQSVIEDFWMSVPNSYQKLVLYANGGWDLSVNLVLYNFPVYSDGSGSCSTQRALVTFRYNSLRDLYLSKNLYVIKVAWLTGENTVYDHPIRFQSWHWSALNDGTYDSFFENIVWEVLGRMCHLIQDLSVPAHVHADEHGLHEDSFESFMENDRYWTGQLVNNSVGSFINAFVSNDPLHYLMYTMAQIADHFGSDGPYEGDGNDLITGNPSVEETNYLNSLPLNSLGPPTGMAGPFDAANLTNIRDKAIPYAIRATAGLLYWFAREAELIPPPPPPPIAPGATNITSTSFTANWTSVSEATSYRLDVATDPGFSSLLPQYSNLDVGNVISWPVSGLNPNTTYYYRVRAANVGGPSENSNTVNVAMPPAAPQLASPINGFREGPISPTLAWNAVSGAMHYHLQVSMNSGFTDLDFDDSNLTATSQQVEYLESNHTHYWRVRAKNAAGWGDWSATWSFTTGPPPPSPPTLLSPSNGATGVSTSPTLSWSTSTGATGYHLQVSTSPSFSSFTVNDSSLVTASRQVGPLQYNTTYWWHVNAKNAAGTSNWSSTWSFTTVVQQYYLTVNSSYGTTTGQDWYDDGSTACAGFLFLRVRNE